MKKLFLCLLFFVSTAFVVAVDTYIEKLNATSNGKDITIEFRTSNEKNILLFEVERSINNGSFKKIATIYAKGYPTTYKYIDQEAFLKDSEGEKVSSNSYSYRIKIVFKDGSSLNSNIVNVEHKVNGFYRSWGMIKEMFK